MDIDDKTLSKRNIQLYARVSMKMIWKKIKKMNELADVMRKSKPISSFKISSFLNDACETNK